MRYRSSLLVSALIGIIAVGWFMNHPAQASGLIQSAYNLIENGGTAVAREPTVNFINGGCVDNAGANRTDCTVSGAGGYSTIQNNGTPLTTRSVLNFTTNMTCVDNSGNMSTDCSSSGGGGTATGGIVTYSGGSLTPAGTIYFPIGGGAVSSSTETAVDVESPAAATVQNFYVQLSAAPGTGNSITFTWRQNAASTALTCTIATAATSCHDTTHTFNAAQGDLLDIQVVTTGAIVGALTNVMATQFGVGASGGGGVSINAPYLTDGTHLYLFPGFTVTGQATPANGFAWQNQGTATDTVLSSGAVYLLAPTAGSSDNIRYWAASVPAGTYTRTTALLATTLGGDYGHIGFGYYSSVTNKLEEIALADNGDVSVNQFNSFTGFSGRVVDNPWWWRGVVFFQVQNDGTNLYFRFSVDGTNFYLLYTDALSSGWFSGGAPNYLGIIEDNNSGGGSVASLATVLAYQ